ncbi:MAG: hypothetical protein M1833_004660 [Piccolia ochrophora]|nr:MAG: hypothetical protein M1833_004660 [Piccolia ochrophora]
MDEPVTTGSQGGDAPWRGNSYLPIAELSPSLGASPSRSIRAIVSLIWPYSASKHSVALLLTEPDFRLRRNRGQVKVYFKGPSARAVARSGITSGDEVVLGLEGAEWLTDEQATSTPGRGIEWALVFQGRLLLQSRRAPVINLDDPALTPEEDARAQDYSRSPSPIGATPVYRPQKQIDDDADHWSSPAFLKRTRISSGPFFEAGYDPFAEDDGYIQGKGRKKPRFSRGHEGWTYVEESPSPDATNATNVMADINAKEAGSSDSTERSLAPGVAGKLLGEERKEGPTSSSSIRSSDGEEDASEEIVHPPANGKHLRTEYQDPNVPGTLLSLQTDTVQRQDTIHQTHDAQIPPISPRLEPVQSPSLPIVSPFLQRSIDPSLTNLDPSQYAYGKHTHSETAADLEETSQGVEKPYEEEVGYLDAPSQLLSHPQDTDAWVQSGTHLPDAQDIPRDSAVAHESMYNNYTEMNERYDGSTWPGPHPTTFDHGFPQQTADSLLNLGPVNTTGTYYGDTSIVDYAPAYTAEEQAYHHGPGFLHEDGSVAAGAGVGAYTHERRLLDHSARQISIGDDPYQQKTGVGEEVAGDGYSSEAGASEESFDEYSSSEDDTHSVKEDSTHVEAALLDELSAAPSTAVNNKETVRQPLEVIEIDSTDSSASVTSSKSASPGPSDAHVDKGLLPTRDTAQYPSQTSSLPASLEGDRQAVALLEVHKESNDQLITPDATQQMEPPLQPPPLSFTEEKEHAPLQPTTPKPSAPEQLKGTNELTKPHGTDNSLQGPSEPDSQSTLNQLSSITPTKPTPMTLSSAVSKPPATSATVHHHPPPPLHPPSGLLTPTAYYPPLPSLGSHFSTPVSILSLVVSATPTARASTGPRDHHLTLRVADPASSPTTVAVQLFRPYKAALPAVRQGDVILLRDVLVRSMKRRVGLVSGGSSGWAVWKGKAQKDGETNEDGVLDHADPESEVQVNGPPVEYGPEEIAAVERLWKWWAGLRSFERNMLQKDGVVGETSRQDEHPDKEASKHGTKGINGVNGVDKSARGHGVAVGGLGGASQ